MSGTIIFLAAYRSLDCVEASSPHSCNQTETFELFAEESPNGAALLRLAGFEPLLYWYVVSKDEIT